MSATEQTEIPAAYQGEAFKHAKELSKGMTVIDTHYGSPRVCTVTKAFTYSVQVEYQGRRYGCPIHHLRRLAQ